MSLSALLAALLGYLFGSFPTGYLAGRAIGHVDVRTVGSGRTGGTNVLRSAGRTAAIITIVGDTLKGAIPVLLARYLWPEHPAAIALAGIFSIIGHNYSLFLGFKGGAGTMTAGGAVLALSPALLALAAPIPLLFTWLTRMSSIGSLLFSALGVVLTVALVWGGVLPAPFLLFAVPFCLLSWYSHRPNIQRLRAGTERRIGDPAAPVPAEPTKMA